MSKMIRAFAPLSTCLLSDAQIMWISHRYVLKPFQYLLGKPNKLVYSIGRATVACGRPADRQLLTVNAPTLRTGQVQRIGVVLR